MAEQGKCYVHVLGGTIVYGVDKKVNCKNYELKVLTVATNMKVTDSRYEC